MMSWCRIHSGTLFSGVDEEGKVLGIHYDLEKPKKEKQNSDEIKPDLRRVVLRHTNNYRR
jgi:hypothetical protein